MEEKIIIFLSKFQNQIDLIEKIYLKIDQRSSLLAKQQITDFIIESTGYWIHNLYCAYEDLFVITSSFWENNINFDGASHKQLLKMMTIEIEGIRPAMLGEESFKYLDELRGFRHVFRHAYSYGLDDERVIFLLKRILKQKENIFKDINNFIQIIKTNL